MLKVNINLIFVAVNLLILYLLMKHFLFKPIHRVLDERQANVDRTLADAESAKAAAAELEQQHRDSMQGIEVQRNQILAAAKKDASAEYDRIVAEARARADGIVRKAVADAEHQRVEILQKAQAEIADMVMEATEKVVGTRAGAQSDRALYNQFLDKAEDSHE